LAKNEAMIAWIHSGKLASATYLLKLVLSEIFIYFDYSHTAVHSCAKLRLRQLFLQISRSLDLQKISNLAKNLSPKEAEWRHIPPGERPQNRQPKFLDSISNATHRVVAFCAKYS
jgi:hypothetical protein